MMANLPKIRLHEEPNQRVQSITEIGGDFTKSLFDGEVTESCVEKARDIGSAMVDCLEEDHRSVAHITHLASHDFYTYQHSVRVAMLSVSISIALSMNDRDVLEKISWI